jgi:hypothetical protein
VAAAAGPEPVGARCVGSRPKQGTQGWLPGGVLETARGGGGRIYFEFKFQSISNQIQIISNFGQPQKDLSDLKKFETKYGFE